MSRLGKKPLTIPEKVKVELKDHALQIQGPLGKIVQPIPDNFQAKIEGNQITLICNGTAREDGMMHGLMRGLLKNNFIGVTAGFKKELEVQGLGYKAIVEGKNLMLSLGFSSPKPFAIPEGIKIVVEKMTNILITGVDKIQVGIAAARIRSLRPPEPYKGTGVRYVGEHIIRKAGKAAAAAGGTGGK